MKNLYVLTVQAMDKYNKALEMGFPEYYINKLDSELDTYYKRIERAGKVEEFRDFAEIY